jgi:1-acyl-sn-glycerol-3-phosphate acyltransferase
MRKFLSSLIFEKWMGWKVTGHFPYDVPKAIIVAAPHTTFADFWLGFFAREVMGVWIQFIGKSDLFWFPLGNLLRLAGGIPVERNKRTNFTESVAQMLRAQTTCYISMSPEGTRKPVEKLKTGFYYIALAANVPIIHAVFDYGNKEVRWAGPFYPTGDIVADMPHILAPFVGVQGKNRVFTAVG